MTGAAPEDEHFLTLHILVLKGMGTAAALAGTLDRGGPATAGALRALAAEGFAQHLEKRDIWRPTAEGKEHHAGLLRQDTPAAVVELIQPWYERFLPLNDRLKSLCTQWQVRDGSPNDHTDDAHDRRVVGELEALHERTTGVLGGLGALRPRYLRLRDRLDSALARLTGGDITAFTGVMRDSYHDVWMELHRDLLLTTGTGRDVEEARLKGTRLVPAEGG
ncbi:hypothetical protein [Streptomyces sp. NPDC001770]